MIFEIFDLCYYFRSIIEDLHHITSMHYLFKLITGKGPVSLNMGKSNPRVSLVKNAATDLSPQTRLYMISCHNSQSTKHFVTLQQNGNVLLKQNQ